MSQALLSLQGVGLSYGSVQALQNISLNIAAGERIAIVGANGAGKSSLLDVISGLVQASTGALSFQGRDVTLSALQKRVQLGIMRSFQRSRLFGQMTVMEHLRCAASARYLSWWYRYAFWCDMQGSVTHELRLQSIAQSLELPLQALASELNYAHQRLLEVGMMLAGDAKLLLLDEPTAGLSQTEATLFLNQLKAHAQDKAIVFIEHDMAVVQALADRVLVLNQGQVLVCTPWKDLSSTLKAYLLTGEADASGNQ